MGTGFPRHDGVFGQPPPRPTPSSLVLPLFSLTACSFVSPGTPGAHGGVVAAVRAYFGPVRSRGNPRPPLRPTMGTGFPRHDGVFRQPPPRPTTSSLVSPPAHSSHRGHPVPTEGWSRRCALTSGGRFVVAGTPPGPGSTMGAGFPRHDEERGHRAPRTRLHCRLCAGSILSP